MLQPASIMEQKRIPFHIDHQPLQVEGRLSIMSDSPSSLSLRQISPLYNFPGARRDPDPLGRPWPWRTFRRAGKWRFWSRTYGWRNRRFGPEWHTWRRIWPSPWSSYSGGWLLASGWLWERPFRVGRFAPPSVNVEVGSNIIFRKQPFSLLPYTVIQELSQRVVEGPA